jgi:HlyD family secretion protein
MFKNRRNIWIFAGVSVVVIVAIVLIIASIRSQGSSTAAYQTVTVQRGTLTASVEGSGTVASIQSASLAWQTTGQVEKVDAQIGDQVHNGEVLASLSQSSLSPNILSAQVDLSNAQQSLNNLSHPDGATLAAAQVSLANAYKSFNTASSDLYTALYKVQSNGDSTLYDTLNAKRSAMNTALNTVPLATADTKVQAYYWAVRANQLGQTDMDYASIKADLRPKIDAAIADKVDVLVTAQADYETVAVNFAASLIDSNSAILVNSSLATYRNVTATLSAAQEKMYTLTIASDPAEVAAAQAKVDAAQTTINLAQITAPFDGTITQVSVNPGDIASAGTKAFRVDNLSQMVVTLQVIEIDVNSVKAGQPATITFDAIPNKIYNGKIVRADMAGTAGQNSVNFNVTVELTDTNAQVKPGMAANVSIVTNKVDNALLVPSTAIFTDSNGQQYVYLVQNGTPTAILVTVGAVSDTTSQITGDTLKEGDTIVLSFASTTSSSSSRGFGLGGLGGLGGGGGGGGRIDVGPAVTP